MYLKTGEATALWKIPISEDRLFRDLHRVGDGNGLHLPWRVAIGVDGCSKMALHTSHRNTGLKLLSANSGKGKTTYKKEFSPCCSESEFPHSDTLNKEFTFQMSYLPHTLPRAAVFSLRSCLTFPQGWLCGQAPWPFSHYNFRMTSGLPPTSLSYISSGCLFYFLEFDFFLN